MLDGVTSDNANTLYIQQQCTTVGQFAILVSLGHGFECHAEDA
jgi:hypothetical protein